VIGLAALATYGVMLAHSKVFQIYDTWTFREALNRENKPAKEIPEIPSLIGQLEIPAIDLSVMVRRGTDKWTLNRSAGHIEGTALPWEHGNFAIAGHRDGVFRPLKGISRNDLVRLTTFKGTYQYRVDKIQIVEPTDSGVLAPSQKAEITLVTCYPFYFIGDAPKRFVVTAHRVEENNLEPRAASLSALTR
jgi:sortase A